MPSKQYTYDVFLSHNSKDKPAVEWLATKLTDQAKLTVFLDIWNLVPGDPWQEDLENALAASTTVAVFLGPAGISGWHNEELRNALSTRVGDRARRVVPILLPGTEMPEENEIPAFLQRLTWVDFRPGLEDPEAFHRLVAGIRGEAPGRSDKPGAAQPPPKPAPKPASQAQPASATQINTGGGAFIGGNVNTGGGDFVGRDKITKAEGGGIAIGGNVTNSTLITGDHNVVGATVNLQVQYLEHIYQAIEQRPDTDPLDQEDLKAAVDEIKAEDEKGDQADETFIARRLRNIQRMAPDILEVVLTTIGNPLARFGVVARKVAEKMRAEAS